MTASPASTHAPDRHTPERTCVACRRKRPQSALTRLTRVDGAWGLSAGHRAGRGAYVCSDTPDCWQDRRLRRAFGAQAPQVAAALTVALLAVQADLPVTPPERPARSAASRATSTASTESTPHAAP
ncbi:YlxR family protein [Deinococcus sp. A31D244]|uniref:YlxR family protein n=1 Tax=Deinococcus sp. A31D244 TaxID=3397675 RepID=UPI0039E0F7CA